MDPRLAAKICLVRGDITGVRADAIVNAANTTLLGGGGVDGRIHRVAGPGLLEECRKLGGCPTGSARITGAHALSARHVIHAVGPVYRDGNSGEPQLLEGCYRAAFALAVENDCKSIAFPAISCGAYGYPIKEAVTIALRVAIEHLARDSRIERVCFVLFDEPAYAVYQDALQRIRAAVAGTRS